MILKWYLKIDKEIVWNFEFRNVVKINNVELHEYKNRF